MTTHPEEIDLLIEARWIAAVDPDVVHKNHSVAIRDSRIIAVIPTNEARKRFRTREKITLDEHILIPGLINLHTHAAMSLMRGIADDLHLMDWLEKHIWPAESAHVSHQFVYDGTRLACAEMLRGGITYFNDMYFYPEAAAMAVDETGIRAMLGITTLEFPTTYANDAEDYISKGLAVRERWLNHSRIGFCIAPHAPYTVSDRTFERCLILSEQLNLPVHCHIHETKNEIEESRKTCQQSPLERLTKLGLTGPSFIGVHAVHMTDKELVECANQGLHIAHCPTSNLKLASGFAPVAKMQKLGINVGLGTDGAASNNRLDLFAEMRLAALLGKGISGDASALSAHQVLRMATLNGANALGMGDKTGSITPGKQADLCAVSLRGINNKPCYDPLSHLIYVSGRDDVSHVWVAGNCCVKDKKLLTVKENDLEAAITLWQNSLEVRRDN